MQKKIIYDHALNEMIRVCLRLEQLFHQIDYHLEDTSIFGTRNTINAIINLLNILDRPDLKAKLAKELSNLLASLMKYGNLPDIDANKFKTLTKQLESHSKSLIDSSGKIGHRLREIELLNMIRMHLASPGGGSSFDLPLYHYWLQQPTDKRQAAIKDWLKDFAQIRAVCELILELVRANSKLEDKTAVHGFHQELLDPQSNLRMIRILLAAEKAAYPEVSIGRHFLSVRFYIPDIIKKLVQHTENLPFQVAYCYL